MKDGSDGGCDPRLNAVASLKYWSCRQQLLDWQCDPWLNAMASLKRPDPKGTVRHHAEVIPGRLPGPGTSTLTMPCSAFEPYGALPGPRITSTASVNTDERIAVRC